MLEEQQPTQQPTSTESVQPQQPVQQEKSTEKTKKNLVRKMPVKTVQQVPVKKKPVQRTAVVRQKKEVLLRKEKKKSDVPLASPPKELPLAPETSVQSSPTEMSTEAHDSYFAHKVVLLLAIAALLFFNQMQIGTVTALLDVSVPISTNSGNSFGNILSFTSSGDLDDVDVTKIQSTAQGIAALFPVDEIKTTEDAITIMVPSGTPEYGEAMGVSFDDPITSMEKLRKAYSALKQQAKADSSVWERYLTLAAAPRGVTCEFCCGVGAQGVTASGELRCGCQHNPAIQSLTMWLMMNTDYSDAEVLKEVYKWKSIWFPKNMVGLALQIAGGDSSVLGDLPGMVGGC
jgi:hypothetical protein